MQDEDERPRRYRFTDDLRDIQRVLRINPEDSNTIAAASADLSFLRELRERETHRRRETVRQIIVSVISMIFGAAGILIANFIHLGKPTP